MLSKSLKRRNQRFNKLTPAQKRVKIAKDVLKSVDSGFFTAQKMSYVKYNQKMDFEEGEELQVLYNKMPSCNVCAIGSLFVCGVLNGNNAKVSSHQYKEPSFNISVDEKAYLDEYFPRKMQQEIERRFEGWDSKYRHEKIENYTDPRLKQRLIDIMNNIIRNNGDFNKSEI